MLLGLLELGECEFGLSHLDPVRSRRVEHGVGRPVSFERHGVGDLRTTDESGVSTRSAMRSAERRRLPSSPGAARYPHPSMSRALVRHEVAQFVTMLVSSRSIAVSRRSAVGHRVEPLRQFGDAVVAGVRA